VFGCNDRCNQENLIAQLSGGVRSLCAPVDNLQSKCQILRHARKTIHRLLNWTDYTPAFFRLCAVLNL
jgi:outer membrane murein-binding lipoprotein Lpp